MLALVALEVLHPRLAQLAPARAEVVGEVLAHAVGDEELRVLGPAVGLLGEANLLLAERLAVRRARALLGRRAVGDVAVDDDQRRPLGLVLERLERAREHRAVVGVADAGDVPAVADEARRDVVGEREARGALDRDPVVVVDPAEVLEPEVAGQRGRLGRDALHHVAVAAQRVDVVVEELVAGAVEVRRLPLGGDRHPDRGGDALAERPRGGLDARRPAVLRMPGAARVDLAEALDVLERDRQLAEPLVGRVDRLHAGEVQQRVEQRRGVADREHEAVATRPDRVVGIEAEVVLPQRVGDRRHRHRRARVARVGGLHGVHRERADRRDRQLVHRRVGLFRGAACVGHGLGGHLSLLRFALDG